MFSSEPFYQFWVIFLKMHKKGTGWNLEIFALRYIQKVFSKNEKLVDKSVELKIFML